MYSKLRRILTPLIAFRLLTAPDSLAGPCSPYAIAGAEFPQEMQLHDLQKQIQRHLKPKSGHLDAYYLFELETREDEISGQAHRFNEKAIGALQELRVTWDLLGLEGRAANFLSVLRERSASLSLPARLMILSALSSRTTPLAPAARALGFTDVTDTGLLAFRVPGTEEYYVQSRGLILKTPARDSNRARILVQNFTTGSFPPYSPLIEDWMEQVLAGRWKNPGEHARYERWVDPKATGTLAGLGNDRERGIVAYSKSADRKSALWAQATAPAAAKMDLSQVASEILPEEMGANPPEDKPLLPDLPPAAPPPTTQFLFTPDGKVQFEGVRREDRFRASSTVQGRTLINEIETELGDPEGRARIGVSRSFAVGPKESRPMTVDKVNIVVDSSTDKEIPYLVYEGNLYAYSGRDKLSAMAMVNRIKAGLPSTKHGDFYAVLRASDVLSDRQGLFSGQAKGLGVGAGWKKRISRFLNIEAEVDAHNGAPHDDVQTIRSDSSGLNEIRGNIILRMQW